MTLDALSALAVSEADRRPRTLSVALTLDDISAAFALTKTSQAVGGAPGRAGKARMGWAWIKGEPVYGTLEELQKLAQAQASPKATQPEPKKRKRRRKSVTLEVSQPLALPELKVIDWLGGAPNMEAYRAATEVQALIARMRQMELEDEEQLLALVIQQEQEQVLAALNLVEQML